MKDLVETVRDYSLRIKNGRTITSAYDHMLGETVELKDEIDNGNSGADGIVGESIDIIACALDIIFQHDPNITNEKLVEIMDRKCKKWEEKYS